MLRKLRREGVWFPFIYCLVVHKSVLQELGSTSPEVRKFQCLLNRYGRKCGVSVPVTGVYDERTRSAVAKFQRCALMVLNADGFVGPETARHLRIKLIGE